jgi:hypothetical protein
VGLKDELTAEVKKTFADSWDEQPTTVVPAAENLRLIENYLTHDNH